MGISCLSSASLARLRFRAVLVFNLRIGRLVDQVWQQPSAQQLLPDKETDLVTRVAHFQRRPLGQGFRFGFVQVNQQSDHQNLLNHVYWTYLQQDIEKWRKEKGIISFPS